jgi:hypothetical protein
VVDDFDVLGLDKNASKNQQCRSDGLQENLKYLHGAISK